MICSTFAVESLSPGLRNPYPGDLNRLVAAMGLLMRQTRKSFFDESGDCAGAEITACEELLRQTIAASGSKHGESALLPGIEGQRHRRRVPGRLLLYGHQLYSLLSQPDSGRSPLD
jgi:hypothetical protein